MPEQPSLFPPPRPPARTKRPRLKIRRAEAPTELGRGPGDISDPDALTKLADLKTYLDRTAGEPMEGES